MYIEVLLLLVIVYICIFAYTKFKNYFGLLICGLGVFCNFLVMSVNGFKMPVKTNMSLTDKYIALSDKTQLRFLVDTISIGSWILSIGDIIIIMGVLILLLNLVLDIRLFFRGEFS